MTPEGHPSPAGEGLMGKGLRRGRRLGHNLTDLLAFSQPPASTAFPCPRAGAPTRTRARMTCFDRTPRATVESLPPRSGCRRSPPRATEPSWRTPAARGRPAVIPDRMRRVMIASETRVDPQDPADSHVGRGRSGAPDARRRRPATAGEAPCRTRGRTKVLNRRAIFSAHRDLGDEFPTARSGPWRHPLAVGSRRAVRPVRIQAQPQLRRSTSWRTSPMTPTTISDAETAIIRVRHPASATNSAKP